MLKPSDGAEGVKQFIIQTVQNAGGNPCPPVVVGVGIGGGGLWKKRLSWPSIPL